MASEVRKAMPLGWESVDSKAKDMYAEQFGTAVNSATAWKLFAGMLVCVVLGMVVWNIKMLMVFQNIRPLVIRTDEVGRAMAVRYEDFEYKPREAEIKYFLNKFVRLYYGRSRYTVRQDFVQAQGFMVPSLAGKVREGWEKSKTIEKYIEAGSQEIGIDVTQVSIEDIQARPLKATVDFEEVFYDESRTEKKRVVLRAQFKFVFLDRVPTNLVPFNPLGLAIAEFREDVAFDG